MTDLCAQGHPAAKKSPSRGIAVCAVGLAVATAVVLASIAGSLKTAPASSGEASATRLAAQRFYAAANQVLLTGDNGPLAALVATDARIGDASSGGWMSSETFVRELAEVGSKSPGTRLEIVSLTDHGHEAVTLVRFSGNAGHLISVAGVDPSGVWVDRLTVRDGIVTGLSGGTVSLRSSKVWFSGVVPHMGFVAAVGVVSLTLTNGSSIPLDAPGTLVGLVENGAIHLAFDGDSSGSELYKDGVSIAELEPGQSITLRGGDRFTVLPRTKFTMRNGSPGTADLRLVGVLNPSGLEPGTAVKNHHSRFSGFLVDGPADATWAGSTGGRAVMNRKREFETGPGTKRFSLEQIVLDIGAGLTQWLQASNQDHSVVMTLQGTIVLDPADGQPGLDGWPSLLEGPARTVLSQQAVRVQQIGARPATLLVVRVEHQDASAQYPLPAR